MVHVNGPSSLDTSIDHGFLTGHSATTKRCMILASTKLGITNPEGL
jgi:hypothetical protein